jgi:hypothetical protein
MNKREIDVPPLRCVLDMKYYISAMLNTKKNSKYGAE